MRARSPAWRLATVVAIAVCVLVVELSVASKERSLFGDFRAFYCGGYALLHGENPYAAAPMLRCEAAAQPLGLYGEREGVALPAPFPGYALAFYALIAVLPYLPAVFFWLAVLCASFAASAFFLSRLCGRSTAALVGLLTMGFAAAVIPYGELSPCIMAVLCGAAYAARLGRWFVAYAALAFLAILPHAALPVYAAAFVWRKESRLPIACIVAALALLDFAAGPHIALPYFQSVLHAQATSEIGFVTQYSVTWIAQSFGASDRAALLLGDGSYAVMAALGIWFGGVLMRRFRDPAYLLLVPAAFALIGGPYMHYSEILLALPAALVLYSQGRGAAQMLSGASIALVALPWPWLVTHPARIGEIAVGAVLISGAIFGPGARAALRSAFCATIAGAAIVVAASHFGPQTVPHAVAPHLNSGLASVSWAHGVSQDAFSRGAVWWIAKAPTWIGLLCLALGCAYAVAEKDGVPAVAIEQAPAGA